MGGNVFKDKYEVVRLDTKTLREVYSRWKGIIGHYTDNIAMIPSYKTKETHGDLDILLTCTEDRWLGIKKNLAHDTDFVVNSNVISLYDRDYKFQVDLIRVKEEEFMSSLSYFSYNDLGNLRGRIAHKLGFKLGHDGLKIIVKDGDYLIGEVPISTDVFEIDWILGWDPALTSVIYMDGPNTLEDMFQYVISNKYFSPSIYLLENRNHASRIRDRKRKTYTEFLKYCETLNGGTYHTVDKQKFIQNFLNENPGHRLRYKELIELRERKKLIKQKFNGHIVQEITALSGNELGMFMKHLKEFITDDYVLSCSEKELRDAIELSYKTYRSEK